MTRNVTLAFMVLWSIPIHAQYEGYDYTPDGIYTKMLSFGEETITLGQADLATVTFGYSLVGMTDPTPVSTQSLVLNGRLLFDDCSAWRNAPDSALIRTISPMTEGALYSFILPYKMIAQSAFDKLPQGLIDPNRWVRIDLHYVHGLALPDVAAHLMQVCQQGELREVASLDLLRIAEGCEQMQRYGDIGLSWETHGLGDTIKKGKTIQIRYTTHLLDGTGIDTSTEMEFVYGRPGQVVEGMHYALSFLAEGDHVSAYIPSHLAFGTNGLKNQIVPRNTPLIFDLEILSVH